MFSLTVFLVASRNRTIFCSPYLQSLAPRRNDWNYPRYTKPSINVTLIWKRRDQRIRFLIPHLGFSITLTLWIQRSLRHKLSLEPIFVNVKKTSDERESVSNSDPDTRGNDWVIDIRRINVPKRSRKRRKSVGCGSSSPLPSIPPPLAPAPAPSIGTPSQVANEPHVASTSAQAYSVNEYANGFQPAIYQAQINSGFVPHPVHMMSHNYAGYLQPPSYTQLSTPPQAPINGVVPPPFHITINNNYENCTFFQWSIISLSSSLHSVSSIVSRYKSLFLECIRYPGATRIREIPQVNW